MGSSRRHDHFRRRAVRVTAQLRGQCRTEAAGRAWLPAAESHKLGAGGRSSVQRAAAQRRHRAIPGVARSRVRSTLRVSRRVRAAQHRSARGAEPARRRKHNRPVMFSSGQARGLRAVCGAAHRRVVTGCKPRDPQGERITRVMRDAAPSDSGGPAERHVRQACRRAVPANDSSFQRTASRLTATTDC